MTRPSVPRLFVVALGAFLLLATGAAAQPCGPLAPIANNQPADATPVMNNFTLLLGCINQAPGVPASALRGWIGGLTMSNDPVSPNTVIDTSQGSATSDDGTMVMTLAVAFAKNTGPWGFGNGVGCLDTGSVPQTSTWYHLFVIATDAGTVDQLCSTNVNPQPASMGGTMPANYTKKRRIGSFKTSSGAVVPFTQNGDEFLLTSPVQETTPTITTTFQTIPLLATPPSIEVTALIRGFMGNGSVDMLGLITATSDGSTATNNPVGNANIYAVAGRSASFSLAIRTSTGQLIKAAATAAATNLSLVTYGWIDTRGRFN